MSKAEGDHHVWVMALTGTPPPFCAGADLTAIGAGRPDELEMDRGGFGDSGPHLIAADSALSSSANASSAPIESLLGPLSAGRATASAATQDGVEAFVEKSSPTWTGR
jgi:hypothetical protein